MDFYPEKEIWKDVSMDDQHYLKYIQINFQTIILEKSIFYSLPEKVVSKLPTQNNSFLGYCICYSSKSMAKDLYGIR